MNRAVSLLLCLCPCLLLSGRVSGQSRLKLDARIHATYDHNLFRGPRDLALPDGQVLTPREFHHRVWGSAPYLRVYAYRRVNDHVLRIRSYGQGELYPFLNIANNTTLKSEIEHGYQLQERVQLQHDLSFKWRERFSEDGLPHILAFPYDYLYLQYRFGGEVQVGKRLELAMAAILRGKSMKDEGLKTLRFREHGLSFLGTSSWPLENEQAIALRLEITHLRRAYSRANPFIDPDEDILNPTAGENLGFEIQDFRRNYWYLKTSVTAHPHPALEVVGRWSAKTRRNGNDPRFDFNAWAGEIEMRLQRPKWRLMIETSFQLKRYANLRLDFAPDPFQYRHWRIGLEATKPLFSGLALQGSAYWNKRTSNADRIESLAFRSFDTWGLRLGFHWRWEKNRKK